MNEEKVNSGWKRNQGQLMTGWATKVDVETFGGKKKSKVNAGCISWSLKGNADDVYIWRVSPNQEEDVTEKNPMGEVTLDEALHSGPVVAAITRKFYDVFGLDDLKALLSSFGASKIGDLTHDSVRRFVHEARVAISVEMRLQGYTPHITLAEVLTFKGKAPKK